MSITPIKAKLRALHDHVLAIDMDFGEVKTSSGIVLRSDDGKSHGIKPRWAKVYVIGPEQTDVKVGQWILVEHGRWTRKMLIDDGESVKNVHRIDVDGIMAVSDEPPNSEDLIIKDSV